LFLLWICSSRSGFWAGQVIFVFPPVHLPAQLPPKAWLFSPPDFICRSARSVSSLGVSSVSASSAHWIRPAFFFYCQLISQSVQCSSALLRCCLRFGLAPLNSAVIPARSCRSPRPLRFLFVHFCRRSLCAGRSGGQLYLPYTHQSLVLPRDFLIRLLQRLCVLLCTLLDFRSKSSVFDL
jgi:hypothetical protein